MTANPREFRVFLRALEPDDYQTTIKWRNDDEIWSMLIGRKYFVSEDYERKWMEKIVCGNSGDIALAICTVADRRHIGNYYLRNIDFFNRSASSSKLIGERDYWGKGYGTEATLLMLYHAFIDLGLARVESRQLIGNRASIRVLEKCGYQTEGVLRKACLKNGELVDVNLMSCLSEDFLKVWGPWKSEA